MRKNILVINPFGIGDVLFSTPLVSSVKEQCPESHIAYICNLKTKDILATNHTINEVFVFERDEYRNLWKGSKLAAIKKFFSFWKEIEKRKFDIVFDLSLGKEYAFFSWLIGIKDRRGFNYKNRGRFLNHRIEFDGFNGKPVAEYYLDLFRLTESPYGDSVSRNAVLVTTDSDKAYIDNFLIQSGIKDTDILVGIAPGGGMSFGEKDQDRRRWLPERFAELADRTIEKFNAKIVLIWGPGEEKLVKEIKNLMKEKALIAPQTTIRQMAALCKRCSIVVCSEGGPLHIAVSQGIKTISIFGPVDEKVYGPYPKGENNIVITSQIECRPCYRRFKLPECNTRKCLDDILVDTVFNALSKQLYIFYIVKNVKLLVEGQGESVK